MGLFKTDNRKQSVVLQRTAWAISSYIAYFVIGLLAVDAGLLQLSLQGYLFSFSFIFVVQIVFYMIVRMGYYEYLRNSTFLFYQILFGFTVLSYLMIFVVPDLRATLVNVALVGLLFGIFALERRHFYILAAVPFSIFTVLLVLDFFQGLNKDKMPVFLSQWIVSLFLLVSFSFIGSYLSALRKNLRANKQQLHRQKDQLEVTHRELNSALRQMSEKAVRDELTGLYNRHQLSETMHSYISIMQTPGSPLGIMMMDVDNFKQVNDTHGHLAGDEILRSFKIIPENCLRKTDFIARYGGEEFVVLLPNTDLPTLEHIAERIRTFVASEIFDNIEKGFGVTVSIGTTHYQYRETVEEVIARADKALYQAKMGGRNKVVYIA